MIENFWLNIELFHFLNSWAGQNTYLDYFFIFMGEYLIFILLILFLFYFFRLIWKDRKIELKEFIWYFSGAFGAWVLAKIIKYFLPTERPFSFLDNVNYLSSESSFSSFPSGHATFAFALATTVYLYNKKIGWYFFVGAFLAALGRIFVGVHFPLDIFIGALMGIITSFVFYKLWKKYLT